MSSENAPPAVATRKFRVITYIDGFNLYFGIRREAVKLGTLGAPNPRWYRYMWLDVTAMSRSLLTPAQELTRTKYFTAPITGSRGKQERQNLYLDALRTRENVEIILGRFEPDRRECQICHSAAYHPHEKKTDVNIAVGLICDAMDDSYDTAIIVSGDSDLVPAVEAVKRLRPEKRLVAAFPPNRYSQDLKEATHVTPIRIWEPVLRKCRLPERICRTGLPDIICPRKYTGEPGCTSVAYGTSAGSTHS